MAQSMWQQTEEMAKQHEQNAGFWLKLQNDGDKAVVVFLGEPFPREVCFIDGKYVEFDEKLKAQGHKASLRVALNVALFDTQEVKVLEQGIIFFKDLVRVKEKYGLDRWAFEVQRHGAAKDPKTSYSILPEHQVSPEQQKAFQALPLHDLGKLYAGENEGGGSSSLGSYDQKAGGTVDPKVAQAIVAELKALPREAVDRFLQKFGVRRIKDLPAGQVEKARAFVEQVQAELAAPAASDADVDPFA
jgi:hypothetical protein